MQGIIRDINPADFRYMPVAFDMCCRTRYACGREELY